MLNRIAVTISITFSPFLVPLPTILLLVRKYAVTIQQALLWTLIVALFISVLPSLFIMMLVRSGRLSDLHLAVRKQRLVPLCFALASALAGTVILYQIDAPREIVLPNLAYTINAILFTAITQLWKISFHSGNVAGCITVLMLLVDVKLAWLFLLLPLIAWARVHRKRHTILQTAAAAMIAAASTATVLQFSLAIFGM
jgi:hypothetical protein